MFSGNSAALVVGNDRSRETGGQVVALRPEGPEERAEAGYAPE